MLWYHRHILYYAERPIRICCQCECQSHAHTHKRTVAPSLSKHASDGRTAMTSEKIILCGRPKIFERKENDVRKGTFGIAPPPLPHSQTISPESPFLSLPSPQKRRSRKKKRSTSKACHFLPKREIYFPLSSPVALAHANVKILPSKAA